MEWQSIAGQLAQIGLPALGTLFGGPLGGTIGGLVGKGVAAALGVEPTPQAVSTAIAADPNAAAVKLAQIESEAKAKEGDLADIANARATTVQLVQAGSSIAWGAPIISIIVVISFIALVGLMMFRQVPDNQVTLVLFGNFATAFGAVIQFWIGSSESSRRNADAIREVARSATTPGPAQVATQVAQAIKR